MPTMSWGVKNLPFFSSVRASMSKPTTEKVDASFGVQSEKSNKKEGAKV